MDSSLPGERGRASADLPGGIMQQRPNTRPTTRRAIRKRARRRRTGLLASVSTLTAGALLLLGLPAMSLAAETDPATPGPTVTEPVDPGTGGTGTDTGTGESTEPTESAEPTEPADPTDQATESPADPAEPATDDADGTTDPGATADPGTTGEPLVTQSARTADAGVGVFAVPAPGAGEAVIAVRTGDDRQIGDPNAIAPLSGVQLGLYDAASGGNLLFTCTADAAGDCSFVVPDTGAGGANRDRAMWVRQVSAPAGYFLNPFIRTGDAFGGDNQASPYSFRVGQLVNGVWQVRAGQTYTTTPPAEFMVSTGNTNRQASGGVWQTSRDNPTLPPQCGLDVALIMDMSGSVQTSIDQARAAGVTLVDSLVGTPSRVGLFTFGATAPAPGANNQNRPISPVSTAGDAAVVNGWINGLTAAGSTNWDRGLYQVAVSSAEYDVAIILTDGNPTVYGTETAPGNFTRIREVENAIFSANAVKAEGTRVVALGVGTGVSAPEAALNLRAISGGTAFDGSNPTAADYYQTTDYEAAGDAMRALALGNCLGSVSVVKQVIPPTGTVADAAPAGGWAISAADATAGITVSTPNPADGTTAPATGTVNYPLEFAGGTSSGTVTIRETLQAGFAHEPQSGVNAVCVDLTTNLPVAGVANAPVVAGRPGVVVPVTPNAAVSCTIYNRAPAETATLRVDKFWVVNGGPPVAHGQQNPLLSGIATVDGGLTGFGTTVPGLTSGDTVAVNEQIGSLPTLCTLESQTVTSYNGVPVGADLAQGDYDAVLGDGSNVAVITNSLDCPSRLTLRKEVQGGPASPSLWTLDALTPSGGLAFPGGADGGSGVTGDVTPGLVYPLAEAGGDPLYTQLDDRDPVLSVPGSTGSWACVPLDANGTPTGGNAGGLNGGVVVGFGNWVQCTAVNRSAQLTLVKELDASSTPRVPSDWDLVATPRSKDVPGVDTQTVKSGTTIQVRPGATYDLTEANGPDGWELTSLVCTTGPDGEEVPATSVALDALAEVTCTYTNTPTPGISIEKAYLLDGEGATAVEAGEEFDYVITVTVTGAVPLHDLVVTDPFDSQLEVATPIQASVVPAGLALDVDPAANTLEATGAGPFEPGDSFTITVRMKVKVPPPVDTPSVGPSDPIPPVPVVDMADIPNEACVAALDESDEPLTACADVDVPTKKIASNAYVRCVNDVPWMYYSIAVTPSVPQGPITVTWVSADDGIHPVQTETRTIPFDQLDGRMLWPGAVVDANGVPSLWPGYRPLQPGDDPNSPLVFNGPNGSVILDESLPSFAWRNTAIPAQVTFQINPEQTVLAVYPQARPDCALTPSGFPVTGIEAGSAAWLGGALVAVGGLLAVGIWIRRRRMEA
ncbi:hypothetical protein ACDF64_10640 [Agromyces sp. MMS24-JH15]|uniref:prealbumin-like fold domain-containing protein n=1 Tax=Agromyces sp. MMS24-JH15 TaxID=3243765 RepID=UPI003749AF4E